MSDEINFKKPDVSKVNFLEFINPEIDQSKYLEDYEELSTRTFNLMAHGDNMQGSFLLQVKKGHKQKFIQSLNLLFKMYLEKKPKEIGAE